VHFGPEIYICVQFNEETILIIVINITSSKGRFNDHQEFLKHSSSAGMQIDEVLENSKKNA